ncbi:MAG TPA: DNA polymerase Y family protein [Steroidobacteraceae bacterium]|nr:DNA polymerase Y family protein [Steroidobacteraceae bacterium]
MNPLQQQLFDLPAPAPVEPPASAPAPAPAPVRLCEVPAPQARVATAPARELWAAVQCDAWMIAGGSSPAPVTGVPADLLRAAQGFTPRVAVESSDALLLELAGSQRLFGGLTGLLQALRAAFPRPLRLALAPTPLAAVLLARAGANCCILDPSRLKGRLAPLPLQHLRWPDDELQRLASMGVHTLAGLLRLPRAGLARRIGPERLWQLDRLTGTRADPRTALPMPQPFHERVDPGHETLDRERLLAALQPTLERLEIFLRERQRGVMALRLTLEHRRAPALQCVLRCVVPEYRAARFTALLAARLERIALAEPVRSMTFTAGRLRRFPAASQPLWAAGEQGGAATATQAPEFLQTLMARLGEQAVYGMAEVDEHRPECQQQRRWPALVTAGKARHETASLSQGSAAPAGAARPLTLLEQPQPLQALRDAAGHVRTLRHAGRELALVSGPERIESGWWDGGAIARDYYVARASDGARWWIFRECEPPRRWFLHGCFA